MNGININNLFPSLNGASTTNHPIDIRTLYSSSRQTPSTIENSYKQVNSFDLHKMLETPKIKQEQANAFYKKRFDMILNKIGNAHNFNMTSIICDVPPIVFRCPMYNPQACLDYIEDRLRKLYMDTLILGDRSVFISWVNIEENEKLQNDDNQDNQDNRHN